MQNHLKCKKNCFTFDVCVRRMLIYEVAVSDVYIRRIVTKGLKKIYRRTWFLYPSDIDSFLLSRISPPAWNERRGGSLACSRLHDSTSMAYYGTSTFIQKLQSTCEVTIPPKFESALLFWR